MTVNAPREGLIRMAPSQLRAEEDGTVLVGHAAVFNEWTTIDSWEGKFRERIAPGSFRKTLRERADRIKVLFNHGTDPTIGDKPLGKPRTMKEDGVGFYTETPLDDTSYNADIKALLRSGALDGMSFRMSVLRDKWDEPEDALPERTIQEVRLYEFGPVTFPAYTDTTAALRAHVPAAEQAWSQVFDPEPEGAPDEDEPAEEATRHDPPDAPLPEHPSPKPDEMRRWLSNARDRLDLQLRRAS